MKKFFTHLPVIVPIVVITFVAFLPSLWNEFVDWDDTRNFINNPHYRGLGSDHLIWMFTTSHMGPYQPLTWITFALDYLLWGMNPLGYHLTNVFLHAASAVLFYFVALRLMSLAGGAQTDAPLRIAPRPGAIWGAHWPFAIG